MDKRFLRICLVVFLVGILGIIFSSPKSYVDKYDFEDCEVHIVKSGETLWTICEGYCPDEIDLREYIELVMEVSDKKDAKLISGEVLRLPIIGNNPSVSKADDLQSLSHSVTAPFTQGSRREPEGGIK